MAEGTVVGLRLWRVRRPARLLTGAARDAPRRGGSGAARRRSPSGGSGAAIVVVAALAVFAIQSLGWPTAPGRDLESYVAVYVDFWHADAVFPWEMLSRTPVAPLVVGGILDLGSPILVEVFAALLFAGPFCCTRTPRGCSAPGRPCSSRPR